MSKVKPKKGRFENMNYEVLLNDDEVKEILNLNSPFGERIKWFQNRYSIEELKNDRKVKFIFSLVQGSAIFGNIHNNPKDLICPNCSGEFIVRTYAGDLYYRLCNKTRVQKELEKHSFIQMGLYNNQWATGDCYTRDYLCLNCAIRWNKKDENVYRDIEELKINKIGGIL